MWFQALPSEIAEVLGLPGAANPDAVLVAESGREIIRKGDRFHLYEGTLPVRGVVSATLATVIGASQMLQEARRPVAHEIVPLWVVYECNSPHDAECWRQTILSRGFEKNSQTVEHTVARKGLFVLAQIHGRANSRFLQKGAPNSLYNRLVNWRKPVYVPEGETQFPGGLDAEAARSRAVAFFNAISGASSITNEPGGNHHLDHAASDKIRLDAGFDVSGFKRVGAALNDPLFLAGIDHHGSIRSRLRRILKKGTEMLTDTQMSGVAAGNKTAAEIRDIYHTLIQDYETDAPKHFDLLRDAVLAVAQESPKLPAHQVQGLKTWHNNVSGALGGATNPTQGRLTAKWLVVLSIVAAHQIDLTPTYTGVTPEHIFFWAVYGSPVRLSRSAAQAGIKLQMKEIPYYPKTAYDDMTHRGAIYNVLTSEAGMPVAGEDWEENFLARSKHAMLNPRDGLGENYTPGVGTLTDEQKSIIKGFMPIMAAYDREQEMYDGEPTFVYYENELARLGESGLTQHQVNGILSAKTYEDAVDAAERRAGKDTLNAGETIADGKPVPLSQRFTGSSDIRESDSDFGRLIKTEDVTTSKGVKITCKAYLKNTVVMPLLHVVALRDGTKIGGANFNVRDWSFEGKNNETVVVKDLHPTGVLVDVRRQGVASALYSFAKRVMPGFIIGKARRADRTDDGHAFRKSFKESREPAAMPRISAQSLSSMVSQDQAERNAYKAWVEAQPGATMGAEMGAKYAQLKNRPKDDVFGDAVRQDKFMKMRFDFDKFTDKDWADYWLLAQHCDNSRDFQKNALSMIKKYQGTDHKNYKFLYDRISMGLTGKQKYGTQIEALTGGQQDFALHKLQFGSRPALVRRAGKDTLNAGETIADDNTGRVKVMRRSEFASDEEWDEAVRKMDADLHHPSNFKNRSAPSPSLYDPWHGVLKVVRPQFGNWPFAVEYAGQRVGYGDTEEKAIQAAEQTYRNFHKAPLRLT